MRYGELCFTPLKGFLLILFIGCYNFIYSQEFTGDWNGVGDTWTASACGLDITTSVSNEQNGGFVSFSTDDIGCNTAGTFSSNAVVGLPALEPLLNYGSAGGSAVITFTFGQPVTDPVLHIDRLGGGTNVHSTSAQLILTTPGINLQRLSGNDAHFEVNGTQITRTPNQNWVGTPFGECGPPTQGSSAGSIRLVGTFTNVSFRFEQNGTGNVSDAIEVVWELNCPPPSLPDFDNDGIPDQDDLDDDNDGILDTVEQNGIPTLDTDSDGLIDSFDLDSDGDGCNDVIEAGFEDQDANGSLGTAPDDVDANGLIINAVDGYTTPNDLDSNAVFDFQEVSVIVFLQDPLDSTVCANEDASFQVIVENSNSMTWEMSLDNGNTWVDVPGNSTYNGEHTETLSISNALLGDDGTLFRVRADVLGSVCDPVVYSQTAQLNVFDAPNSGEDVTLELCPNDNPIDLLNELGGNADPGGSWSPLLNSGTNTFDPSIDLSGTYTYTIGSGSCQSASTVQISIGQEPVIDTVDFTNTNNNNQIVISVVDPGDFEYSIDGENFQESNTFQNLESGQYTVYVRDGMGCSTVTETVEIVGVIDYPRFFTPNQDGVNDGWQIEQKDIPDTRTYIYDRYGKLLKVLVGEDEHWDGTYQNKRMPSTDYWFKVIANNEILLKGHFSLKR